jgi:hypothetical protein
MVSPPLRALRVWFFTDEQSPIVVPSNLCRDLENTAELLEDPLLDLDTSEEINFPEYRVKGVHFTQLSNSIAESLFCSTDGSLGTRATTMSNALLCRFLGFVEPTHIPWYGLRSAEASGAASFVPHQHQLIGAASILQAMWAQDSSIAKNSTTSNPRFDGATNGVVQLLNDFVGAGKTLQVILVLLGIGFAHQCGLKSSMELSTTNAVHLPPFMSQCRAYLQAKSDIPLVCTDEPGSFPRPAKIHQDNMERFSIGRGFMKAVPPNAPSLVIAPPGLYEQWWRELSRSVDQELVQIVRYDSTSEIADCTERLKLCGGRFNSRSLILLAESTTMIRQWKDQVKPRSSKANGKTLFEMNFVAIVVDEAHGYRNPHTDASKSLRALSELSCVRLAVTATPVVNQPADIENIMKACRHPLSEDFASKEFDRCLQAVTSQAHSARVRERQYMAVREVLKPSQAGTCPDDIKLAVQQLCDVAKIDAKIVEEETEAASAETRQTLEDAYIGVLNRYAGSIVHRPRRATMWPSTCFEDLGYVKDDVTASETEVILQLPTIKGNMKLFARPPRRKRTLWPKLWQRSFPNPSRQLS